MFKNKIKKQTKILSLFLALLTFMMVFMSAIPVSAAQTDIASTSFAITPSVSASLSNSYDGNGITIRGGSNFSSFLSDLYKNSGYKYRYYYYDGGWRQIATTKSNFYNWNPPSGGRTYKFTVRMIDSRGNFVSDFDRYGYSLYYCRRPGGFKLKDTNDGVRITWDACNGAGGYRVYSSYNNSTWNCIGFTRGTSFVHKTPGLGIYNYYTVRAMNYSNTVCYSYFKKSDNRIYEGCARDVWRVADNIEDEINDGSGYYSGSSKYGNGCNIYQDYVNLYPDSDWCAAFAAYCIGKGLGGNFVGEYDRSSNCYYVDTPSAWHGCCDEWARWANRYGIFRQQTSYTPSPGDVVFFRPEGRSDTYGNITHVGIFLRKNSNNQYVVIEGNINNYNARYSTVGVRYYNASTLKGNGKAISGYIETASIAEREAASAIHDYWG